MDNIIFMLIFVYAMPSIIAIFRSHHNVPAIVSLNIFFGWTALGWIIAFIWSLTNTSKVRS